MKIHNQKCPCGETIMNDHGLRAIRFARINGDGSVDAKCKRCGEFNRVPLRYVASDNSGPHTA